MATSKAKRSAAAKKAARTRKRNAAAKKAARSKAAAKRRRSAAAKKGGKRKAAKRKAPKRKAAKRKAPKRKASCVNRLYDDIVGCGGDTLDSFGHPRFPRYRGCVPARGDSRSEQYLADVDVAETSDGALVG